MPDATAAAAPPLEPPAVRPRCQGFDVRAENRVCTLIVAEEWRDVRMADDHRAGRAEPSGDRAILVGDAVEDRRADRRAQPCDVVAILERERDAMQWTARRPARESDIGGLGLTQGRLEVQRHDRFQLWIPSLYASEVGVERLYS